MMGCSKSPKVNINITSQTKKKDIIIYNGPQVSPYHGVTSILFLLFFISRFFFVECDFNKSQEIGKIYPWPGITTKRMIEDICQTNSLHVLPLRRGCEITWNDFLDNGMTVTTLGEKVEIYFSKSGSNKFHVICDDGQTSDINIKVVDKVTRFTCIGIEDKYNFPKWHNHIYTGSLADCPGLTEISITQPVEFISQFAFDHSLLLKEINILEDMQKDHAIYTSVKGILFQGKKTLFRVPIGYEEDIDVSDVDVIMDGAFRGCTRNLIFPMEKIEVVISICGVIFHSEETIPEAELNENLEVDALLHFYIDGKVVDLPNINLSSFETITNTGNEVTLTFNTQEPTIIVPIKFVYKDSWSELKSTEPKLLYFTYKPIDPVKAVVELEIPLNDCVRVTSIWMGGVNITGDNDFYTFSLHKLTPHKAGDFSVWGLNSQGEKLKFKLTVERLSVIGNELLIPEGVTHITKEMIPEGVSGGVVIKIHSNVKDIDENAFNLLINGAEEKPTIRYVEDTILPVFMAVYNNSIFNNDEPVKWRLLQSGPIVIGIVYELNGIGFTPETMSRISIKESEENPLSITAEMHGINSFTGNGYQLSLDNIDFLPPGTVSFSIESEPPNQTEASLGDDICFEKEEADVIVLIESEKICEEVDKELFSIKRGNDGFCICFFRKGKFYVINSGEATQIDVSKASIVGEMIVVPDSVRNITSEILEDCGMVKGVSISSLASIKDGAFAKCSGDLVVSLRGAKFSFNVYDACDNWLGNKQHEGVIKFTRSNIKFESISEGIENQELKRFRMLVGGENKTVVGILEELKPEYEVVFEVTDGEKWLEVEGGKMLFEIKKEVETDILIEKGRHFHSPEPYIIESVLPSHVGQECYQINDYSLTFQCRGQFDLELSLSCRNGIHNNVASVAHRFHVVEECKDGTCTIQDKLVNEDYNRYCSSKCPKLTIAESVTYLSESFLESVPNGVSLEITGMDVAHAVLINGEEIGQNVSLDYGLYDMSFLTKYTPSYLENLMVKNIVEGCPSVVAFEKRTGECHVNYEIKNKEHVLLSLETSFNYDFKMKDLEREYSVVVGAGLNLKAPTGSEFFKYPSTVEVPPYVQVESGTNVLSFTFVNVGTYRIPIELGRGEVLINEEITVSSVRLVPSEGIVNIPTAITFLLPGLIEADGLTTIVIHNNLDISDEAFEGLPPNTKLSLGCESHVACYPYKRSGPDGREWTIVDSNNKVAYSAGEVAVKCEMNLLENLERKIGLLVNGSATSTFYLTNNKSVQVGKVSFFVDVDLPLQINLEIPLTVFVCGFEPQTLYVGERTQLQKPEECNGPFHISNGSSLLPEEYLEFNESGPYTVTCNGEVESYEFNYNCIKLNENCDDVVRVPDDVIKITNNSFNSLCTNKLNIVLPNPHVCVDESSISSINVQNITVEGITLVFKAEYEKNYKTHDAFVIDEAIETDLHLGEKIKVSVTVPDIRGCWSGYSLTVDKEINITESMQSQLVELQAMVKIGEKLYPFGQKTTRMFYVSGIIARENKSVYVGELLPMHNEATIRFVSGDGITSNSIIKGKGFNMYSDGVECEEEGENNIEETNEEEAYEGDMKKSQISSFSCDGVISCPPSTQSFFFNQEGMFEVIETFRIICYNVTVEPPRDGLLVIPSKVTYLPSKYISSYCDVDNVKFHNNVVYVDEMAFGLCEMVGKALPAFLFPSLSVRHTLKEGGKLLSQPFTPRKGAVTVNVEFNFSSFPSFVRGDMLHTFIEDEETDKFIIPAETLGDVYQDFTVKVKIGEMIFNVIDVYEVFVEVDIEAFGEGTVSVGQSVRIFLKNGFFGNPNCSFKPSGSCSISDKTGGGVKFYFVLDKEGTYITKSNFGNGTRTYNAAVPVQTGNSLRIPRLSIKLNNELLKNCGSAKELVLHEGITKIEVSNPQTCSFETVKFNGMSMSYTIYHDNKLMNGTNPFSVGKESTIRVDITYSKRIPIINDVIMTLEYGTLKINGSTGKIQPTTELPSIKVKLTFVLNGKALLLDERMLSLDILNP